MNNSFLTTALVLAVAVVIAAAGYGLGVSSSAQTATGCFAERGVKQRECFEKGTADCMDQTRWVDAKGNSGYDREKLQICLKTLGGGTFIFNKTKAK